MPLTPCLRPTLQVGYKVYHLNFYRERSNSWTYGLISHTSYKYIWVFRDLLPSDPTKLNNAVQSIPFNRHAILPASTSLPFFLYMFLSLSLTLSSSSILISNSLEHSFIQLKSWLNFYQTDHLPLICNLNFFHCIIKCTFSLTIPLFHPVQNIRLSLSSLY